MISTTWELHYSAPRSPDDLELVLVDLGELKCKYTEMRMDYLSDEDGIHIMIGDVEVFMSVIGSMMNVIGIVAERPIKITVQFDAGPVRGELVLDEEGDEKTEIDLPDKPPI